MVYSGTDEEKKIARIVLDCDCGHGAIEITQFTYDGYDGYGGMVYIGYKEDGWHTNYQPVRQSIKRFFHNLWEVLSGKEYTHFSILLQGYEVKALKEAIAKLEEEGAIKK